MDTNHIHEEVSKNTLYGIPVGLIDHICSVLVALEMNYDQKVAWIRARLRRIIAKRLSESFESWSWRSPSE